MPGGREAALKALARHRRQGGKLDGFLRESTAELDPREAALATRLCYGVTQTERLLELGLSDFVNLKRAHPKIIDILYAGAYQLWFMDKIPRHALVDESVRLARKAAPHSAGMVNAVLRRLPDEPPESDDPRVRYSIPDWMWERVSAVYGAEQAEAFFRACNDIPPVTAHINPLKPGLAPPEGEPHPFLPGCVNISGSVDRMESFRRGGFTVADAASRLCVLALGTRPGMSVWDVCAAPGGKTAMTAFEMNNDGYILSTDVSPEKLSPLDAAMTRLGVTIVKAATGDGRVFSPDREFDAVLCDAPCSGLGVLRKKPDIRNRTREQAALLPPVQLAILQNAARFVKPGGTLVYSTCTVLPEENEEVAAEFLRGNSGFRPVGFTLPGIGDFPDGQVTLLPHRHGTDGFFIAKMERIS